jgi:hypothetical protein
VAASLKEFGWRQPIVVDAGGVIVVGHTRLLAAQKLALAQAPVHVATNLTPAQVKAYRLADNRLHEETGWDRELLALEVEELGTFAYEDLFVGTHAGLPLPGERADDPDGPVPTTSHVRMVQVFVANADWEKFRTALAACALRYGTTTTTDTIIRCVEETAKLPKPA